MSQPATVRGVLVDGTSQTVTRGFVDLAEGVITSLGKTEIPTRSDSAQRVDAPADGQIVQATNETEIKVAPLGSPSFIPPASEIDKMVRAHHSAAVASSALRKALNALGAQTDIVSAVIARPGLSAGSVEVIDAMESLFEAQRRVAAKVAEHLHIDSSVQGAMPRLIRAVTPLVTSAWRSGQDLDHETLAAVAAKAAIFSEIDMTTSMDVVDSIQIDRSMAIYAASVRVARGLDDMLSSQEYDQLPLVLRMAMTGGSGRDHIMRESIKITLGVTQDMVDKLLVANDPDGLSTDHERQIVFRAILRSVSQTAESVMQYEGTRALVAYIREEFAFIKERQQRFEDIHPAGAFTSWLDMRLRERMNSIPALDSSFRAGITL